MNDMNSPQQPGHEVILQTHPSEPEEVKNQHPRPEPLNMEIVNQENQQPKQDSNTNRTPKNNNNANNPQWIQRALKVNGKLVMYKGPNHPRIHDLLDILEERQETPYRLKVLEYLRIKWDSMDDWFKRKCVFLDGYIQITPFGMTVVIGYVVIYIVFLFQAIDLSSQTIVKQTSWKTIIASNLPLYGGIFTLYNLIFQLFESIFLYILFFIGLVLVPISILLFKDFDIQNSFASAIFDIQEIVALTFIPFLYIYGIFLNLLMNWIKNLPMFNRFVTTIFNVGTCLLLPYFVLFQILRFILKLKAYEFIPIVEGILEFLTIPFIIIIVFSWSLIYVRLFELPLDVITIGLKRVQNKLRSNSLKPVDMYNNYLYWQSVETEQRQGKFSLAKQVYRLVSLLMGGLYITLEILLLYQIISEINQTTQNLKLIVTLLFEIFAIPFFLLLGICISVSTRSTSDTFLYIPIFVGAGPNFGLVILNNFLTSITTATASISSFLIGGPAIISLLWLSLALFGIERRRIYLMSIFFMCFFFAVPIGVLIPLDFAGIGYTWMKFIYLSLLGVGVLILAGYLLFTLGKYIFLGIQNIRNDQSFLNIAELMYYNLQEYAFWLNASCFIFAFFLMSFYFWNMPSSITPDEKGTLISLLFIHVILFVLVNIALRAPSLSVESEIDVEEIDDELTILEKKQEKIERQRKLLLLSYEKYLVLFCTLVPFCVLFPIGTIMSNRFIRTWLVGLSLGVPSSFLMFHILVLIKNAYEPLQNFTQPFISSMLWCCIFFPFGVVVPITSIAISNERKTFQTFIQFAIVFGLAVCMFGVTSFSLFFQILLNVKFAENIFKKEEEERRRKFIVTKLQAVLLDDAIQNDANTANLVYEAFRKNAKLFRKNLENRKPVYVIPYSGTDLSFNQTLVSENRFKNFLTTQGKEEDAKKLKQQELEEKQKEEERRRQRKWYICLMDCIYCRFFDFKLELANNQLQIDRLALENLYDNETGQKFNLANVLPEFKTVFNQAYAMEQDYYTDVTQTLLSNLENNPEAAMIRKNQNQPYISSTEIKSSKTDAFKEIPDKAVDPKIKSKLMLTDYGQSLAKNKSMLPEFLHEVFSEFSNTDEENKPSITYIDLKEMFRLSNILSRDGVKVDLGILNSKKNQTIPPDVDNEDDPGLIDEEWLKDSFTKCASYIWINQSRTMTEHDFAKLLIMLMRELVPEKDNPFDMLLEFTVEFLYPNLIHNVKSIMSNLKSSNRQALKKLQNSSEEDSPFIEKNFQKIEREQRQATAHGKAKNQQAKENLLYGNQLMVVKQEVSRQESNVNANTQRKQSRRQSLIEQQEQKDQQLQKVPCCKRCCRATCRCLHDCFWVWPDRCCKWTALKIFGPSKPQIVRSAQKRLYGQRLKMPPWKEVTADLDKVLVESSEEYDRLKKEEEYKFNPRMIVRLIAYSIYQSNLLALQGRLADMYSLMNIAFDSKVDWFGNNSSSNNSTNVVTGETFYNSFTAYFFLSLTMAIVYGGLGIRAAEHNKNNTLGLDENGERAKFPHRQYFFTLSLSFLGASQFMLIMKTFIDAFVCDFACNKKKLSISYKTTTIECFSDQHFLYMGLALVGTGIYYPLSTFLYPSFQYGDKSLDLKYKSAYLIVYVQVKLLILGISTLFSSIGGQGASIAVTIHMGFSFIVMLFLIILYLRMQPCYIKWMNTFELLLFIIILGFYGGAFTILITGVFYLGWIVAGFFFLFSIVNAIIMIRRMRQEKVFPDLGLHQNPNLNIDAPGKYRIENNHLKQSKQASEKQFKESIQMSQRVLKTINTKKNLKRKRRKPPRIMMGSNKKTNNKTK